MVLKNIIEGLQIFAKHCNPEKSYICAEHDEIFAGQDTKDSLTAEDTARLLELGWDYDDSYDSWQAFT